MQFIKDGPEIPVDLLQAQEEGNVVFFCGAGVSYKSGLPGFKDLVGRLYKCFNTKQTPLEKKTIKSGRYDAAISMLQKRVAGGREKIEEALFNILQPPTNTKSARKTHEAIIHLSRGLNDQHRLVTTNFDLIFEQVIKKEKLNIPVHNAPFLPVPKRNNWQGIVHLHGAISAQKKIDHQNRIVISSDDFGTAYLTERWAARFVTELFRNYVVCFVGYSIDDPILRYMMDALASDRVNGNISQKAFAFGSYTNDIKNTEEEWLSKGVTPILYKIKNKGDHSNLHDTLEEWAKVARVGSSGKESIVAQYATKPPQGCTQDDNFVGRVIWALSDRSGKPAKLFSELNPTPPIDWLEKFSVRNLDMDDLPRYGNYLSYSSFKDLKYSLIWRPAPIELASKMSLFGSSSTINDWDQVMDSIANWLMKYLQNDAFVLWVVSSQQGLHHSFVRKIRRELYNNKSQPQISASYKALWELIVEGRTSPSREDYSIYEWFRKLESSGFTVSVISEFRDVLRPYIKLSKKINWPSSTSEVVKDPNKPCDIVGGMVYLNSHAIRSFFEGSSFTESQWELNSHLFLDVLDSLLLEVFDLRLRFGEISESSDYSEIDQPSISDHPQNRYTEDWSYLIKLTRDAWLKMLEVDRVEASKYIHIWWNRPYGIFKRLALFGLTRDFTLLPDSYVVDLLLTSNSKWLWSSSMKRELMQFLANLPASFSKTEIHRLENAILKGPEDLAKYDVEHREAIKAEAIRLRLTKLNSSGHSLSRESTKIINEMPGYAESKEAREEFSYWVETGWGRSPFYEQIDISNFKSRAEIVSWLVSKKNDFPDGKLDDVWQKVCEEQPKKVLTALIDLANQDIWISQAWSTAIASWTDLKFKTSVWNKFSNKFINAPESFILEISFELSSWLQSISKNDVKNTENFVHISSKIISVEFDRPKEFSLQAAINHPVGKVVDGLLQHWYKRSLTDDCLLEDPFRSFFARICSSKADAMYLGKAVLSMHLISLYRVDRNWTSENLLPEFNWNNETNKAALLWSSFLFSSRLHQPLMKRLEQDFFECANHLSELGDATVSYADFVTFIALEAPQLLAKSKLRNCLHYLSRCELKTISLTALRLLQGASSRREEYWNKRFVPFFKNFWVADDIGTDDNTRSNIALICVYSGNKFPIAIDMLESWLKPTANPHSILSTINETNLARDFSSETLRFLDMVISDRATFIQNELSTCLNVLEENLVNIESDRKYQRLKGFLH